jgi:hypothetical protein
VTENSAAFPVRIIIEVLRIKNSKKNKQWVLKEPMALQQHRTVFNTYNDVNDLEKPLRKNTEKYTVHAHIHIKGKVSRDF